MIPARVALALQADGWYLRSDIIWAKPNPMPESVTDRPTSAHEHVFLLTKSARYYYDADAVREPAIYGGEQLGIVRGSKRRARAMGVEPHGNEMPGAEASIPDRRNLRNEQGLTYAIEVGDYFRNLDGDVTEWLFGAAPMELRQNLKKFKVPRFTRTVSQWFNLLVQTGFSLERVEEPRPSDETVRACPDMQDAQVVAYFLHVRVRNPHHFNRLLKGG